MPTNDIGNITASLKLESAAFIRDLTRASQATATSSKAIQTHMAGLSSTFDAAASRVKHLVLAFAGLEGLHFLQDLVKTVDEIGDASIKLGVAADDLQRFRFAGQQAGLSIDQLDGALKLFQKNLASGKIAATGDTLIEQFSDFIQQINNAPTQLDEVAVATKGLGKQFQTGLQIAREGQTEFKKWFEEAATFSAGAIHNADVLDKQIRALKDAAEVGFGSGLLSAFSDGLSTSAEQLARIEDIFSRLGKMIGETINTDLKDLHRLQAAGAAIIDYITEKYKELKAARDKVAADEFGLAPGAGKGHQGPFGPGGAMGAGIFPEPFNKPIGAAAATEEQEKYAAKLQRTIQQQQQLSAALAQGVSQYDALKRQIEATNAVADKGIDINSQYGKSQIAAAVQADELSDAVKRQAEQLTENKQLIQDFADTVRSSFVDAIVEARSFSDVLTDLAKDIERLALNFFLKQAIGSVALPGAPGTGLLGAAGFHSGGIVGRSAAPLRHVDPSLFNFAPRLHQGLRSGEYPAILQAGEQVIPRGQNDNVTVNVINNSNAQAKTSERKDTTGRTIDVLIDQFDSTLGQRIVEGRSKVGGAIESTYGAKRVAR